MIDLAERWTAGSRTGSRKRATVASSARLPRGVRLDCAPAPERASARCVDVALERYLHLFALNRGILLPPFLLALMSPATTQRTSISTRTYSARPSSSWRSSTPTGSRRPRCPWQRHQARLTCDDLPSRNAATSTTRAETPSATATRPRRAVAPHGLEVAQRDHDPAVGPANEIGQFKADAAALVAGATVLIRLGRM